MVLTTENNSEKVYIPRYKELKAVLEELQKPDILNDISNDDFIKFCKPTWVNGYPDEYRPDHFGIYYSVDKGIQFLYRPMYLWHDNSDNYDLTPRFGKDFYIKDCSTFKTIEDSSGFVERLKRNVHSKLVSLLSSKKIPKDTEASFIRVFRGFRFIEDLYDDDCSDYINSSIKQISKFAIQESLSPRISETVALMANKDGIYSNAIKNHLNNFAKERLLKLKKSKFNIELTDLFKSILVTGSVLGKEFDEKLLDEALGVTGIYFSNSQTFGKSQREIFIYAMDLLTEFDNSGLISKNTSDNIKKIKITVFRNNSVENIIEILEGCGGIDYFTKNIIKPIADFTKTKIGVFVKRDKYCLELIESMEVNGVTYESFGIKPTRTDVFEEFRYDIDKLMNKDFLKIISGRNFNQRIFIPLHTKTYLMSIMKLKHIDEEYVKVVEEKFAEKDFDKSGKFGKIKSKLKEGSIYLIE